MAFTNAYVTCVDDLEVLTEAVGQVMPDLFTTSPISHQDLEKEGVPIVPRRKLLHAVLERKNGSESMRMLPVQLRNPCAQAGGSLRSSSQSPRTTPTGVASTRRTSASCTKVITHLS